MPIKAVGLSICSITLWLSLTSVSIADSDDLEISPLNGLNLSLPFGGDTTQALEVTNLDPDEAASWQVVYENESQDLVERAVNLLETKPERLLKDLPGRYLFAGGETGNQIGGGNPMYQWGNVINMNGSRIAYANLLPATTPLDGGSVRYMTAKLDGLFVFTGELEGVPEFSISGFLNHDGDSDVEVDEFSLEIGGITWRAFVKRVTKSRVKLHRFRPPSVLQIFLVPDAPGITRTFDENARVDGHAVSGLPASTPFHYLLFSRPQGGNYGLDVFEKLAQNYLEELLPGPRWCRPAPVAAVTAGGDSSSIDLQIDARQLPAGLHETRLAVLPAGLEPEALPETAWRKVSLEVSPATFGAGANTPSITGLNGYNPESAEFNLIPMEGGSLPGTITVNSSVPWLEAQSLGDGRWQLQANTAELSPILHLPELTISDGVSTITLQVPVLVASRHIRHLVADPTRPRLYGLSRVEDDPGFVIIYNTSTQEETGVIPVGRGPIDFDLTEQAKEMIVLNNAEPSMTRIDLDTLGVIETVPLAGFDSSTSPFEGRIVDGPGSLVYYVDEAESARLQVFDLSNLTVQQSFSADLIPLEFPEEGYGFGDFVISPDRKHLYGWAWNGSDFGGRPYRSQLVSFDIDASGMLSNFNYSDEFTDAGDSEIHLSLDGKTLAFRNSAINRESLNRINKQFSADAFSISPGGEVIGLFNALYRIDNDSRIPVSSLAPNTFTPDYSWFAGIGDTEDIVWTDLSSVVTPEELGLAFSPSDGGGVILPGSLTWVPVPDVRRYIVYLGTDAAAVAAATPESTEFFGEVAGFEIQLPADLTPGETYHWRVEPVDGLDPSFESVRSFSVLPLTLSRNFIESTTVNGATERREPLGIDVPAATSWNIGADVPWLSSNPASGTGPGEISLIINAGDLDPGNYQGNVTLTVNGSDALIPIEITVINSSYQKVASDPEEAVIWTLRGDTNQPNFLATYETDTELLTSAVPTNLMASYLAVHPRDNRTYVAQRYPATIHGYDQNTLEHVSSIDLADYFDGTEFNSGLRAITAGPAGRLVVEFLEANRSVILLIDTETGEITDEFSLGDIPAGDGGASKDGRFYYHGDANFSGADITKFDLQNDQITEVKTTHFSGRSNSGGFGPHISANGERILWNSGILDADLNLLNVVDQFLFGISPDGSFVIGPRDIFNASNGLEIGRLPVGTQSQAYDLTGENLYLFDREVTVVNLAEFTALPDNDVVAQPEDGARIAGTSVELSWTPVPSAFSYNIYFGTDRDTLAAAGPDDPSFLGTVEDPQWRETLTGLELEGEYFWRVDMNGFSQTRKGSVQQFTVASIETLPGKVVVIAIRNEAIPEQSVAFRANETKSWTAVSNDLWIELLTTEGDTSEELRFTIDESRVNGRPRTYEGSITISSGSESFVLPVEVDILDLEITLMAADPGRPLVYGVNSGDWDHLFAIDGATAEILAMIRLGRNVTDMVIDPVTDRLIATDWNTNETRVVDLKTFQELEPLNIGSNVYRLEIDPVRRTLVTEGQQQAIDILFYDLDTLELKTSISGRAGDGKLDPVNNVYYRAENSSNADFLKYDLSTNPPTLEKQLEHGSSIHRFLLTRDGEFPIWRTTVYNKDLEVANILPQEPVCLSPGDELAVGQTGVYWLDDGTLARELPLLSEVSSFTSDGEYLLTFSRQQDLLQSIPINEIADLPGPFPHDGSVISELPEELSWSPVEGAESYTLTLKSPSLGELVFENLQTPSFPLTVELANGEFVEWSVQAQIPNQPSVDSPTYRFGKRYPRRQILEGGRFDSVAMGPHHILTAVGSQKYELRSIDPLTGEVELLEANPLSSGGQGSGTGERARLDRARGTLAFPSLGTEADHDGVIYQLDAAVYDRVRTTELLPPPGTIRNWGGDVAVSGGLQLAGRLVTEDNLFRVVAYHTHPRFEATQLIGASDSWVGDNFGETITIFGNIAAISSGGNSSSSNPRLPAIYIFERDPATGQWSEKQKLEVPGVESRESINNLVMNDRFLAATGVRFDSLHIYERGQDGMWTSQANFLGVDQQGASNRFGDSLALAGNRVFVGDPDARVDSQEGAVYSFIYDGTGWQKGIPVLPAAPSVRRESFGKTIASWDGWLVVGSGIANTGAFTDATGHLFEIDPNANHSPLLPPTSVTEALAGQPFEITVQATDLDGQEGLILEALQLPAWASLTDEGEGLATLSGIPVGAAGSTHDFQLRVTDPDGATGYEAFRLTLLAPSDVAKITLEPEDVILSEGQDLLLRAGVEGVGPFQWQWFHNGEPIPGATRPSLEIAESQPENAGDYRVEVSNVLGRGVSRTAFVSVTPPQREAGPWTTYGNNPRRSGYHPALLKKHTFVSKWKVPLQPINTASRAVILDGLVGLSGKNNQESLVFGIDLLTGQERWRRVFPDTDDANPISAHKGFFYYQETNRNNSKLWSLSMDNGATNWEGSWTTQSSEYESPAVTDRGVWIGGGYGSGIYGFDLDGTSLFHETLPQLGGLWTPMVSEDRLFTWVLGTLREHDPETGKLLWSIHGPDWGTYRTGIIRGDRAYIGTSQGIIAVDLNEQKILWTREGQFVGAPSLSGNYLHAISLNTVMTLDVDTGESGPTYSIPSEENIVSTKPLLLTDHLILSTEEKTYVYDRENQEIVQEIGRSGKLSYADGYLLIVDDQGIMEAFFANQAPEFSSDLPSEINSGAAALPGQLAMGEFVSDPDPADVLTWEIVSVSRPELFESLEIDPNSSLLSVVYNHWLSGSSEVTISADDQEGNVTEATVTFTVPDHPLPNLEVTDVLVLNRRTGLYEQTITITNVAERAIAGFDLSITGLPEGVTVYNSSGTTANGWTVNNRDPLAAGGTTTLILEYYTPYRGAVLNPLLSASIVSEPEADPEAAAPGLAVDRVEIIEGGVLIEFSSIAGALYEIQYSDDMENWKASPAQVRAGGNRTQWIDRGPPRTDIPPSEKSTRFYRMRKLEEAPGE